MALAWLLIAAIIIAVVIFVGVAWFIVYFQSPQDKNQAWLPKIIVWIGMSASCIIVLLLPYDVANATEDNGVNLAPLWIFFFLGAYGYAFALCPFFMFYYESFDADKILSPLRQLFSAFIYTLIMLAVIFGITLILWGATGTAEIPVQAYVSDVYEPSFDASSITCPTGSCSGLASTLEIKMSFVIFIVAAMTLVGWILFVVFAGIGLVALPMDMINGFRKRARPITLDQYSAQKNKIRLETQKLMKEGQELNERTKAQHTMSVKEKTKLRVKKNEFKSEVFLLELKYSRLEVSYKEKGGSPWVSIFQLLFGLVSLGLSGSWIAQIIINDLADKYPLLNNLFIKLDGYFGLLGVSAYAFYAFYLMICVIKGATRFGLRFVVISIHPMVVHDTLMSSFLFNTSLCILTSVVVIQFCTQTFDVYARSTSANLIFNNYIKNLKGLGPLWDFYLYALLGFSGLAFIYLIFCPKNKRKERLKEQERKEEEMMVLRKDPMEKLNKKNNKKLPKSGPGSKKKKAAKNKELSFASRARKADRI